MKLLNWIDRNVIGFDREEMEYTIDYYLVYLLPVLLVIFAILSFFI